jgi:hypothetical protein
LASSRYRRFAPGRRASWACCWKFWTIPRKTLPSCGDGRPHDSSSLWHSFAQRRISSKARSVVRLRAVDSSAERHAADFALAKTPDEVLRAMEANWPSIFIVSDDSLEQSCSGHVRRTADRGAPEYGYLGDGDVLGFDHSSRKFRTLFRRNSEHNSFLVTERCNDYCLMCSQPPKDVDDRWILSEIKETLPLIDLATHALTFTGGETLSEWEDFFGVLKECRDRLPATAIQVLTNGRAFANSQIVDAWKDIGHPNLTAAIPVYASVDHIHDHVAQARGAFDETVLGILKLKDRSQRVEIRVVLHALTAQNFTPSPTARRAQACSGVRAQSARKADHRGNGPVDRPQSTLRRSRRVDGSRKHGLCHCKRCHALDRSDGLRRRSRQGR